MSIAIKSKLDLVNPPSQAIRLEEDEKTHNQIKTKTNNNRRTITTEKRKEMVSILEMKTIKQHK